MVQRNQIACPRWQMAQLRSRPRRPGSSGLACIHLAILSHGILQAEAEVSRDNIKQGGCFRDPCWVDTLNHILLSRELLETSAHDLPLPSEPWRKDKGHRVMHHLYVPRLSGRPTWKESQLPTTHSAIILIRSYSIQRQTAWSRKMGS